MFQTLSPALPIASASAASPAARQGRRMAPAAQLSAARVAPVSQATFSGERRLPLLAAQHSRSRGVARAHRRATVVASASDDVVAPPGSLVLVAGASGAHSFLHPPTRTRARLFRQRPSRRVAAHQHSTTPRPPAARRSPQLLLQALVQGFSVGTCPSWARALPALRAFRRCTRAVPRVLGACAAASAD